MSDSTAKRILIVEDEPMLAFVLEEYLTDAGFHVVGVASRLDEALAIIARDVCDGAVVDTNLGGLSAAPACEALTQRGVPFIVLSGYSAEQQGIAFAAAAFQLQKPCRPDRLIEALHVMVATRPLEGTGRPENAASRPAS